MASHHSLHKVKLAKNPNYVRDGLKSYAHLMRKYAFTPTLPGPYTIIHEAAAELPSFLRRLHPHKPGTIATHPRLVRRSPSGEIGEVHAEDVQHDTEYLGQIGIGSPAQHLNLDFDTGSADLWVFSSELNNSVIAQCHKTGHVVFESEKSCTFKKMTGETWKIQYGDGSTASGDVGTDDVNIGGLKIKNQAVELAKQMSTAFKTGAGDGLVGLAFSTINTGTPVQLKTPVENMILQSDIPQECEVFTAYLTNSKDNQVPFYSFGFIDPDTANAHGGQINYTPIDKTNGFWQFASSSTSVNGTEVQLPEGSAIADTGTTLALLDDESCKAIYNDIPGACFNKDLGAFVFPSDVGVDQLPEVTLDIGGHPVTLHKQDLAFADAGNGMTYGGVQSRGNLPFSILGDAVLKAIYAVFDVGNERFGFVQRSDPDAKPSACCAVAANQKCEHQEAAPVAGHGETMDAAAKHEDAKSTPAAVQPDSKTSDIAAPPTATTLEQHPLVALEPHPAAPAVAPAVPAVATPAPTAPTPSVLGATSSVAPTIKATDAAPAPGPAAK